MGIEAISATLQEETDTLVDVVEPYLLKLGLVLRTSSGRKASENAYRHLNINFNQKKPQYMRSKGLIRTYLFGMFLLLLNGGLGGG